MAGYGIVTRARLAVTVVAALGLLVVLGPPGVAAAPAVASATSAAWVTGILSDTATVVVSASASTSVTPDRARLRFAIETEAETAAEATRRNAESTTAAIAAVRPHLGDDGELSTSNYSVNPIYSRDTARRVIGYRATNALVVVLDEIERVGATIDAAVGAGANRVDGLSFFAADSRGAYLAALAEAVTQARAEAEVMAAAAGGELGRIVSLESTRTGRPAPVMMAESLARADTPIEPGDQSVGASVRLVIQLLGR